MSKEKNPNKELYQRLRLLSCDELWSREVPRFNKAAPEERFRSVSLVRAVGVVFSETGTPGQREAVRTWLRSLLQDPCEKIRRYAMAALPKIGAGQGEEADLLSLLDKTSAEREKKFLGQTLEKIGGAATLKKIQEGASGLRAQTVQKITASVARTELPSTIKMEAVLSDIANLRIHLHGRRGLELIVRREVEECPRTRRKFKVSEVRSGLVALSPVAPFSLADIYSLRCFGTIGFVIGHATGSDEMKSVDALAEIIVSPLSRRILQTFTDGSIRYRLDFIAEGHQRGAVRLVVTRAYALCPQILNDARSAPWTVEVYPVPLGHRVELTPKLTPDPRWFYRKADVPAASHPPLAASMARLSGKMENEVVWDPFCGSGLELIERALLGGVKRIHGTDRSGEAIAIAAQNSAAANLGSVDARFTCADFHDFARIEGLDKNEVTLVITNPPMGKRVPIRNLRGLIEDLFSASAEVLQPGGRLVFANPFRMENPHPLLKLKSRQIVDFSGFDCSLEVYTKGPR